MGINDIDPAIADAVATIESYIEAVSGWKPSQQQIARALTRYFVLREIHDHIELDTSS